MMYKVTAEFIYRAKLYPIGRELTEFEYNRMIRDKIAVKRGIPEKVAPTDQKTVQSETKETVKAEKETEIKKANKPTTKKKVENKSKTVKKTTKAVKK